MTIPAYEKDASGKFVYNPNNTAGIPNAANLPVNPNANRSPSARGMDRNKPAPAPKPEPERSPSARGMDRNKPAPAPKPEPERSPSARGMDRNKPAPAPKPEPPVAWDPASGKTYDVTDPSKPVDITPEPIYVKDSEGNFTPNPKTHITLPDDKSVPVDEWNKLTEHYQHIGLTQGFDAMQRAIEADRVAFEQNNLKLADDKYIPVDTWNKLSEDIQHIGLTEGFDAMVQAIKTEAERTQQEVLSQLKPYSKEGDEYDIVNFIRDGGDAKTLEKAGFRTEDIANAKEAAKIPESQESFIERYFTKNGWSTNQTRKMLDGETHAQYQMRLIEQDQRLGEATDAYAAKYGVGAVISTGAARLGEWTIAPVARALRPEVAIGDITKAEWIMTGVIAATAAIPAVRGIAAGVRAGRPLTETAGRVALAEIRAPIDFLKDPVKGLKSLGDVAETAIRPGKLPIEALEIRTTTVRVPVAKTGLADEPAKMLRDTATTNVIKGDGTRATIQNTTLDLTPTALNRTTPAAVHSTPDIRPFLEGAVVQPGREGGLFVAPNLHSRFTTTSAFGDLPEGGIKGALIFRDEKILSQLSGSGKIYKPPHSAEVVEIEGLAPAGVNLPKPNQILFTRDMEGNKISLLVFGKPFSQAEIAKMKLLGAADTVKQIFTPAYKIGKGKFSTKVDDLAKANKQAKAFEDDLAKARKAGNKDEVVRLERELSESRERVEYLSKEINRGYTSGRVMPIAIYTGADSLIRRQEDIARDNPEIFRTTSKGADLATYARPERITGDSVRTRLTASTKSEMPVTSDRSEPARVEPGNAEPAKPELTDSESVEPVRPTDERPPEVTPPDYVRPPDQPFDPIRPPSPPRPPDASRVPLTGSGTRPPETPFITPRETGKTTEKKFPIGTICWRQGALDVDPVKQGSEDVIKVLPPPYTVTYTLVDKKPVGWIDKAGKTPQETLQIIGGTTEANVKVPMGITTAWVKAGERDIRFTRTKAENSIKSVFGIEPELLHKPKTKKPNRRSMRPTLQIEKIGKVRRIPGVGLTRRLPRGRIID